jgi:hypothetical protein
VTDRASPTDIAIAIAKIVAGDWIDPPDVPVRWACELYDPDGRRCDCPSEVKAKPAASSKSARRFS